jgi:hypothetical protein
MSLLFIFVSRKKQSNRLKAFFDDFLVLIFRDTVL